MELSPSEQATLLACPPIAALSEQDRNVVLATADVTGAPAQHVIVRQGEPGNSFFILLSGSAEVFRTSEGHELTLVEIGAGDYFGEQALRSSTPGRRTASVRTRESARFVAIPAEVFSTHIESAAKNRAAFEHDAVGQLYNDLRHTLEFYAGGANDPSMAGAQRQTFAAGETVIAEASPSDSAYVILDGSALAIRGQDSDHRQLAQLGVGQIFGELGVLNDSPRAATVVAETELTVLRIEAEAFKDWHSTHPTLAGFVDTLSDVYALADGRSLNVYMGRFEGDETVTTVSGKPHDGVVSTRVMGRDLVVFANAAASGIAGDSEVVEYVSGTNRRELRIIVTARGRRGIKRAVVQGLSAEGISSDLGTLYQSVLKLAEIDETALRRFRRTGFLGGKEQQADRLCPCLGLSREDLAQAAKEVGRDFDALRSNYGVSTLCGGCEPALRAFVNDGEQQSPRPCTVQEDIAEDQLDDDQRWLKNLLASWDEDGDGYLSKEEVRVRLRGLEVRDLDAFIGHLFGDELDAAPGVSLNRLALTISSGDLGYTGERRRPVDPGGFANRLRLLLRPVREHATLSKIVLLLIASLIVLAGLSAGPNWGALVIAIVFACAGVLGFTATGRFVAGLATRGLPEYYATLYRAYDWITGRVRLRPAGPLGPTIFMLRDEAMIDRVLHNPQIYPRNVLGGYPGFGKYCPLGAGSGGEWLGYRSLCEEYFIGGYREDLELIDEIAHERIATWAGRGQINLLDEIYRIVLEIRARVFFQTTFDCFNDAAEVDVAGLVDRVLTPPVLLIGDDHLGEAKILRQIVSDAIKGASRPGSVGRILFEAVEAGQLTELEVIDTACMYVLAQAPTMGIFWTIYRCARDRTQATLRGDRKALVRALKEELRLHPAVPTMLTRTAARDDKVGDRLIPKGSLVVINPFFVHGNPAHWTEPREFQADTWTVLRGDNSDLIDPLTDRSDSARRPQSAPEGAQPQRYLPFGAGPQACQARWFATDEMLAVIDAALKTVDLEVLDDGALLDRPLPEQVMMHVYCRPAQDVVLKVMKLPSTPTDDVSEECPAAEDLSPDLSQA